MPTYHLMQDGAFGVTANVGCTSLSKTVYTFRRLLVRHRRQRLRSARASWSRLAPSSRGRVPASACDASGSHCCAPTEYRSAEALTLGRQCR